jgi:peptidoglycan hydrolase-like protein with peptidoglycan-binding domain
MTMNCEPEYPITLPDCPDPCDKPCRKHCEDSYNDPCGNLHRDPCGDPCQDRHREPCGCDDGNTPAPDPVPDDNNCTDIGGTAMNTDTYPGTALRWGSSGVHVVNMQTRLNRLAQVYTAINTQTVDGKFGQNMYNAVLRFQKQHGLNPDGVIGRQTWDRIVAVDNAQTGGGYTNVTTPYPGYVISRGASGDNVRFIQSYLSAIPGLPATAIDGKFGQNTEYLVRTFQTRYRLQVDGRVGPQTWAAMVQAFNAAH